MGKSKKQYFNEINIMRGMAVFCVVIGHSFNPTEMPTILGFIKSFVYCFHMPAFFFKLLFCKWVVSDKLLQAVL